jgi:hypothetical protein
MALTTYTLDDFRYEAENLLGLEHNSGELDDGTLLVATDKYLKFYRSLEAIKAKEKKMKQPAAFSVTSAGYDLSVLTDIYDYHRGFKVYMGSVSPENRLLPVVQGGSRLGYYIIEDTLYLNGLPNPTTIAIEYQASAQRVLQSDDPTLVVPEIDEAFEDALVRYIAYRHYANKGDNPAMAEDMLNDSRSLTMEVFDLMRKNGVTA